MFDAVQGAQNSVWQQIPVSSVQEQMPSCQCGGPRVREATSAFAAFFIMPMTAAIVEVRFGAIQTTMTVHHFC
jgi:hypothetical protein